MKRLFRREFALTAWLVLLGLALVLPAAAFAAAGWSARMSSTPAPAIRRRTSRGRLINSWSLRR